ncbi:MotA/TolQ/ExbB proton channel [Petrotoga mobilis SJ95]|uniref:MotA/TolQ/ExbB proton channel n=1 Tax=Petrotoga mobilis (strain DSM 10674 / SJ95) TaxID=403833 RepID=A9BEY1_PETMO|nr:MULTISPECIES: motility protein A [Petrotoga]ABX30859.1 MotA/TolQ/ExbB proton channel [Petrotoga mobilis SJ95]PNR92614.1 flagellar motor protein MotP [Petrotoga sp. HWHPT.55.6.3]RLL83302.1 flagellar motor protein MotP [Petrotoga sp. Shatin.DS.tank11.9.2.9.3]RLL90648.1 flagellar motor protein MotP [Petrotoga sp. HKA.pet.4.5]RPD36533.1 flagellar motor protein MotP [Petrotoga sp. HWH.PT.55.6.1]
MDISTIIGLALAIAAIVVGAGSEFTTLIDIPSFFITVVGSVGATFIAHPSSNSFKMFNMILEAFKNPKIDNLETLRTLYSFSEKARRDGMISLEEDIPSVKSDFLRDGLRAAVDGTDPEEIKKILEVKMDMYQETEEDKISVLDTWGAMAPAWGMVGTLIGLVLLLDTLSDPTTIGPRMSLALITTLYGALIAYIFALPPAEKLKKRVDKNINQMRMMLEGILSIVQGENPHLMEEKLKAFLSEEERRAYEAEKGEAVL